MSLSPIYIRLSLEVTCTCTIANHILKVKLMFIHISAPVYEYYVKLMLFSRAGYINLFLAGHKSPLRPAPIYRTHALIYYYQS